MATIDLRTIRSRSRDPNQAAEELCLGLGPAAPRLLMVFAPRDHDHGALNRALRDRLPRARLVGASCVGQIDRGGLHRDAVVAAAISGDFDVGLGLGRRLSIEPIKAGTSAMFEACEDLGLRPMDLTKRHVGIVIDDGLRFRKEEFLVGMLEANPTLVAVGGGAGDDSPDSGRAAGVVHVDGRVATNAVLLALIQTDVRWAAMRMHGYAPTGRTLRVTKVDASGFRALEIDGHPAAKRYSELIDVPIDELDFGKARGFSQYPTGVRVGREWFMRSPWRVLPDGSVQFANLLEEGASLEIMRAGDFVQATRHFLDEEIPARVGPPGAALLFHCNERSRYYDALGRGEELAAAFRQPWAAGMDSHFETYCGISLNTTLNVLAFGR